MNRRLARCLIAPALLLALASGCQGLFGYRPAPVLVRDAETKRPVAGAEVRLSYPPRQVPVGPPDSSETTGDDGVAPAQAAPYGDGGIAVAAAAEGYLSDVAPDWHLFHRRGKRRGTRLLLWPRRATLSQGAAGFFVDRGRG
jgi:hypothetical protein